MMSLIFRIDEEKSLALLGRDENNFREYIDIVCNNAGMDKVGEDEYIVREGYDEDTVIGGLTLAWGDRKELVDSLSEWYWIDDSLPPDDDEYCIDLISETYDFKEKYGW